MHAASIYDNIAGKTDRAIATAEFHLRKICALKSPFIARDKETSLIRVADEAQHAADCNDTKGLFSIVRRLNGVPPRALNTIKDATGKVLTTVDDVTSCWRQHFKALFKANVVDDPGDAATPDQDSEGNDDLAPLLQANSFSPTVKQVHSIIVSLKGDSGVGEDRVSAWLLKAGDWTAAEIIHAIIMEIIYLRQAPIVWRGGRLVVLYKGERRII